MSLLREGDSVNFQKASCTLDGCVKIYTSRVDSVATETGKLLSGLADSNNKKRRGGDDDADQDEDEGDEEGEDGVKKKPRKRVQRSSEATLASSFAQLQLKKMEMEFSVDPLFKKASADFDEGGAKGLLLNHLTVDSQGRIVFDSSDDTQDAQPEQQKDEDNEGEEDPEAVKKANDDDERAKSEQSSIPIDIETLGQRFFPDLSKLDEQDICPSLKTFELGGDAATMDIPFLKAGDDWKKDLNTSKADSGIDLTGDDPVPAFGGDDDDNSDLGGFSMAEDVAFGEGGEAWAKEAAILTQPRPYDGAFDSDDPHETAPDGTGTGTVGAYAPDSAAYGITLSASSHHAGNDTENILSYFDRALSKNWAGPEHWRIRKIKDASASKAANAAPRPRKEKEPFRIDFAAPMSRALHDALYTPATTASAITLPKAQWRSKSRNLLPDDKHFNSKQLLRLFLKPKARIGARSASTYPISNTNARPNGNANADGDDPDQAAMDPAFWARRHAEAAAAQAAEADGANAATGDYDANFFADDNAFGADMDDGDDGGGGDGGGLEFADARETFSPALDGTGGGMGIDGVVASQVTEAGGFGSQLVTQSRRLRPEYVQYARVAKKVDVRRLKEEMWRGMAPLAVLPPPSLSSLSISSPAPQNTITITTSEPNPDPDPDPAAPEKEAVSDTLNFTNIMNGLQSVYPAQAMSDISTSYCFICLLHLANEKSLVLQNRQEGDFEEVVVRRDLVAAASGIELEA